MGDLRIGIITCSDTRAAGDAEDTAGRALTELCEARDWIIVGYDVCPDEVECITASILEMSDVGDAQVILTCGGTGFSPRDVTPEATAIACDRQVPGISEYIRAESMKITGRAMLSRATAGLRGGTLVVNLPGSEKAAREAFGFVADQFEHAAEMAAGGGHG